MACSLNSVTEPLQYMSVLFLYFLSNLASFVERYVSYNDMKQDAEKITVGGMMRSTYAQEMLKQLIDTYELTYRDCNFECVKEHKIDYFFTDQVNLVSDELLDHMKANGTTLCVVQNPMTDGTWDKEAVLINKPLYTLNFCQVLNNESVAFEHSDERLLSFTAPKARILIVDDNEMNLKVAKGLLEPLQMQIDTAGDGKQALDKIQETTYDIVFMDHMMPVMDGVETVHRIRAMEGEYFKNVPVIALTANAVSGARELFFKEGFQDFVSKPIEMSHMEVVLRRWLPDEIIVPLGEEVQQ